MRLLIIGGTSFLGRATAEEALRRGASVTTFNRGRSAPDVDGVEALRGDRASDADLDQLRGRSFEVVVDTCGFVPRVVGSSVRALRDSGAHYVFVSSVSAVPTWPGEPTPEGLDGQPCASDAGPEDGDYGVLKAGCERAVREVLGDRSTIVRAGLIIGPHENVGRVPWWLDRMARAATCSRPATRRSRCSSSTRATWPPSCSTAATRSLLARSTPPRQWPTPRWAAGSRTAPTSQGRARGWSG
jgi:2'-hydroxyisoflavone reductase